MRKIMAAMSGGVDSSVAALLVRRAGSQVAGATLRLWGGADGEGDASQACARLGLPFYGLDCREEFQREVVERFVQAYCQGETPTPCILCNRHIKFGWLLEKARELGFEGVATGHYARVEQDKGTGRWLLKTGLDAQKDQSYMLYSLTQRQLSRTLFPLGGLTKAQVRKLAEEAGLANAHKRDSQDICFVPDGDYAGFIERYTGRPALPGDIVGLSGETYGRHRGIIHYTIGQRKGLGLSFPQPMFVSRIDPQANTVELAPQEALFSQSVKAHSINLIACGALPGPVRVQAKLRYRHPPQPALAEQTGEDEITVTFDQPQRAPTPGQALVLYDGETVVGGGIIGR